MNKEQKISDFLWHRKRKDFFRDDTGEIDNGAWRAYLKRIGVKTISNRELCEAYNNHTPDTIMVESPTDPTQWFIMPTDLADKILVLGEMPPRYSRKHPAKTST